MLSRLRTAVAEQRRVKMGYRDRSGSVTSRAVDPLGLVAKAGVWYLIAYESDKGYRTFRAERIVAAEESGERFERPAGFDLEAHWAESVASIESQSPHAFAVVVRVRNNVRAALTSYWECELLAEEEGAATLRVMFPGRTVALSQILALDDGARIIEPEELTADLIAVARNVLERYALT
jgi:predicted DNA-binding transcriptional regulator YafY